MTQCIDTRLFRITAILLLAVMTIAGFVPRAEAGFIPSADAYAQERGQNMETVQQVLENRMVTKRLSELGYSQEEIKTRMSALSDEELHRVASSIKDIDVAGDGVGLVIGLLVIVALVALIFHFTDTRVTIS
jgi:hypothetical protein